MNHYSQAGTVLIKTVRTARMSRGFYISASPRRRLANKVFISALKLGYDVRGYERGERGGGAVKGGATAAKYAPLLGKTREGGGLNYTKGGLARSMEVKILNKVIDK